MGVKMTVIILSVMEYNGKDWIGIALIVYHEGKKWKRGQFSFDLPICSSPRCWNIQTGCAHSCSIQPFPNVFPSVSSVLMKSGLESRWRKQKQGINWQWNQIVFTTNRKEMYQTFPNYNTIYFLSYDYEPYCTIVKKQFWTTPEKNTQKKQPIITVKTHTVIETHPLKRFSDEKQRFNQDSV